MNWCWDFFSRCSFWRRGLDRFGFCIAGRGKEQTIDEVRNSSHVQRVRHGTLHSSLGRWIPRSRGLDKLDFERKPKMLASPGKCRLLFCLTSFLASQPCQKANYTVTFLLLQRLMMFWRMIPFAALDWVDGAMVPGLFFLPVSWPNRDGSIPSHVTTVSGQIYFLSRIVFKRACFWMIMRFLIASFGSFWVHVRWDRSWRQRQYSTLVA